MTMIATRKSFFCLSPFCSTVGYITNLIFIHYDLKKYFLSFQLVDNSLQNWAMNFRKLLCRIGSQLPKALQGIQMIRPTRMRMRMMLLVRMMKRYCRVVGL